MKPICESFIYTPSTPTEISVSVETVRSCIVYCAYCDRDSYRKIQSIKRLREKSPYMSLKDAIEIITLVANQDEIERCTDSNHLMHG